MSQSIILFGGDSLFYNVRLTFMDCQIEWHSPLRSPLLPHIPRGPLSHGDPSRPGQANRLQSKLTGGQRAQHGRA